MQLLGSRAGAGGADRAASESRGEPEPVGAPVAKPDKPGSSFSDDDIPFEVLPACCLQRGCCWST